MEGSIPRRSDHGQITTCLHCSRPPVVWAPASFPGALSCPSTEVRCMSSLDHDRLPPQGPDHRTRAGSALVRTSGTRIRWVPVPAAEEVPTRAAAPHPESPVAADVTGPARAKAAGTAARKVPAASAEPTVARPAAADTATPQAESTPAPRPRPTPRPRPAVP